MRFICCNFTLKNTQRYSFIIKKTHRGIVLLSLEHFISANQRAKIYKSGIVSVDNCYASSHFHLQRQKRSDIERSSILKVQMIGTNRQKKMNYVIHFNLAELTRLPTLFTCVIV